MKLATIHKKNIHMKSLHREKGEGEEEGSALFYCILHALRFTKSARAFQKKHKILKKQKVTGIRSHTSNS
jgi:hypothetical protein